MRALAAAVVTLAALVVAVPGTAAAAGSRPVYSYADAIRETVWVDTGADEDRDGVPDRVAADIIRPSEPAARGDRVPVIMDTSPYYACCGRGNEAQKKTYAPDGSPLGFPLYYDNYFVPRGYAVVLVDEAGTNRSSGCPNGADVAGSSVAVINWLNGRGSAYRSLTGSSRVSADWSTGAVGMIGKSDDAALAIDAAVTGVPGLRTVVSIAGVGSYYNVFNSDGAWYGFPPNNGNPPGLLNERAAQLCKPVQAEENAAAGTTGDFNRYWRGVDSDLDANRIRASVFAVQGFGDLAVSPRQFGDFWSRLSVPRKAWVHQAGHVDPFDLRRAEWVETLHRWFDHWLLGVDNGIDREPAVKVETSVDHWVDLPTWPPPGTRDTRWELGAGQVTITDDPSLDRYQWAADPDQPSPARAVVMGAPLTAPLHLAGTGSISLTVRSSKPVARLGAELVDYGPATVRDDLGQGAGIRTLSTRSCWGASAPGDSACYLDTTTATVPVDHEVVSAGWADLGHWRTLRRGEPLAPDRFYTMRFTLTTVDHTVATGHRLAIVVGGTDAWQFLAPIDPPTLTIDLARSSITFPTTR
ncbi:CocE/NonD family hydrolase [Labedaea rhizosphaerae]|uniref:X-Pro dipeptidyl-peptidase n=1 Tax=Labedaea rhizosphaerae TaxID=598644 RepID=A0A4R6SB80_LABRH|nr:CocE/NonD family hydrolase [Labedaea rhizosphaerae]TDP97299.1 X-Pro dipeptidyl-peptidase [Labedaea rhizosphaerae]